MGVIFKNWMELLGWKFFGIDRREIPREKIKLDDTLRIDSIMMTCPWCSSRPTLAPATSYQFWSARCIKLGCPVQPIGRECKSKQAAISAWNSWSYMQ